VYQHLKQRDIINDMYHLLNETHHLVKQQSMNTKCISSPYKLNAEHAKADAAFTALRTVRAELILPATESEA